jgi:hypothetical protein
MMDLSDYTLEPIHEDGQLILYRAVHASPADAVARSVLVVEPAGEYVPPATLARLEHEYSLASELDPRWAVRPVKLERYRGRAVLVLVSVNASPCSWLRESCPPNRTRSLPMLCFDPPHDDIGPKRNA